MAPDDASPSIMIFVKLKEFISWFVEWILS